MFRTKIPHVYTRRLVSRTSVSALIKKAEFLVINQIIISVKCGHRVVDRLAMSHEVEILPDLSASNQEIKIYD